MMMTQEKRESLKQVPTNQIRLSIFAIVRRLREQRWFMIKTEQQYIYLYTFTKMWITNQETAKWFKSQFGLVGL